MSTEPAWISAHIFCDAGQDGLLTRCVAPLLRDLRRSHRVTSYFFLRYDERGQHIRLRLRASSEPLVPGVRDAVAAGVNDYLSGVRPTHHPTALEVLSRWDLGPQPAAGIIFTPYASETERYGYGLNTIEDHFQRSSDLALRIVASTNTAERLHAGLVLLETTAAAYGEPLGSRFLTAYAESWPPAPASAEPGRTAAARREITTAITHAFATHRAEECPGCPTPDLEPTWTALLSHTISRYYAEQPRDDTRRTRLAAALVHLLLNRCGIPPPVERWIAATASTRKETPCPTHHDGAPSGSPTTTPSAVS